MVWQAYPQTEHAHMAKVAAFMDRYARGPDDATASVVRAFSQAWNLQSGAAGQCWGELMARRAAITSHARAWAAEIAKCGSLAIKLAEFCENRLK
jgi:hypothetical protein